MKKNVKIINAWFYGFMTRYFLNDNSYFDVDQNNDIIECDGRKIEKDSDFNLYYSGILSNMIYEFNHR